MFNMIAIQPIMMVLSILIGLALGRFFNTTYTTEYLIDICLMLLLFFIFIGIDLNSIKKSFNNKKFSIISLSINFIWTPVFAFILGKLFLNYNIDLRIGFLMLMLTPCTDWFLVFTNIAGGNVSLGAYILPLNLILQIILLPVYLLLFMGTEIDLTASKVIFNVLTIVGIPFLLAQLIKKIRKSSLKIEFLFSNSEYFQIIFLCLAIIAIFSSQAKILFAKPEIFLSMLLPMLIFFVVNFLLSKFISKKVKLKEEDYITLTMTTLARNSPLSLAIAAYAFPNRPLIMLALVIGPIIELPSLMLVSHIIKKRNI